MAEFDQKELKKSPRRAMEKKSNHSFRKALVYWFSNFHGPIMTLSPSPKRSGRSVLCHGRSDLCVMEAVTCVMEEVTCLSGSSPYVDVLHCLQIMSLQQIDIVAEAGDRDCCRILRHGD